MLGTASVSSGTAVWRVKLREKTAIVGVGTARTDVEKWAGADAESWGFDVGDGQKAHGGWSAYSRVRGHPGSDVEVRLEFPRGGLGKLSFWVDGRACGTAFTDVRGPVRLAVSLKQGGSATIIEHRSAATTAPAATGHARTQDTWLGHSATITTRLGGRVAHRTRGGSNSRVAYGAAAVSSGVAKWTLEGTSAFLVGVCTTSVALESWLGSDAHGWGYDGSDGQKAHSGAWSAYGPRFSRTATVQLDMTTRKLSFSGDGSPVTMAFVIPTHVSELHVAVALSQDCSVTIKSFTHVGGRTVAAPSGPSAARSHAAPAAAAALADPLVMSESSDRWASHSALVQLERGSSIAHRPPHSGGANSRMAIGNVGISAGKATWRLRIIKGPCIVGIARPGADMESWCGATDRSWGFDGGDGQKCHGGHWSRYSTGFGEGSEVSLILDLDRHTLHFAVDGADRGEAFNSIHPGDGPYRVAIALGQGAQVALVGLSVPAVAGARTGSGGIVEGFQGPGGKCSSLIKLVAPDTVERTQAGANSRSVLGRHGFTSGRVTWTCKVLTGPCIIGVARPQMDVEKWVGGDRYGWGYDGSDGQKAHSGWSGFGRAYSTGDTVSVTANFGNHSVSFAVNGSSVGVAFRDLSGPAFLGVSLGQNKKVKVIGVEFSAPPSVVVPDSFGAAAAAAAVREAAAAVSSPVARGGAVSDRFDPTHCSSLVRIKDGGHTASRNAPGSNSRVVLGQRTVDAGRAEWTVAMVGGAAIVGVATTAIDCESYLGSSRDGWGYDGSDGQKTNGSWQTYARRFGAHDSVTVCLDSTAGTLRYKVNGVDVGVAFSNLSGRSVRLAVALSNNCGVKLVSASFPSGAGGAAPVPAAAPSGPLTDIWDASKMSTTIRVEPGDGTVITRHGAGSNSRTALGKFVLNGGKASWTVKVIDGPAIVGVATDRANLESYLGCDSSGWGYDGSDGQKTNGRWQSFSRAFSSGSQVTIKCDMDRGTLAYDVGGETVGVAFTNLRGRSVRVAVALSHLKGAKIVACDLSEARGVGGTPQSSAAASSAASSGTASGPGGAGGRAGAGASPPPRRLPLEFDEARTYSGITVSGPRATLSHAEPGHSRTAISKRGYSSGRHAWNVKVETAGVIVGAAVASTPQHTYLGSNGGYGYDGTDGQIAHSGSWSYFGSGFNAGDTVTVVVDFSASTIEFLVNNVPHGVAARDVGAFGTVFPAVSLAHVGNSATLAAASSLPSPAAGMTRRTVAAAATPKDQAREAMAQLQRGMTTAELDGAIMKLLDIARTHREVLSWKDIVEMVKLKRDSPSFPAAMWTPGVAKNFGQLLRMVKFGRAGT